MGRHSEDSDLERRVRRDLSFLLSEHGAVVTSNLTEPYGISEVSVAAGNLEFQFPKNAREGRELVKVGPRNGQGIWELLHVALAASTREKVESLLSRVSFSDNPESLSYVGLSRLASVLKSRFERLDKAFAPENYSTTRLRMVQIERSIHPRC